MRRNERRKVDVNPSTGAVALDVQPAAEAPHDHRDAGQAEGGTAFACARKRLKARA